MKDRLRIVLVLLCIGTMFSFNINAYAQPLFPDVLPPELSLISCEHGGDDCEVKLTVTPLQDTIDAEQQRLYVYNDYISHKQASAASAGDSEWCTYPFTVHFEVSADGKAWAELKKQHGVLSAQDYSFFVISDALSILTASNILPALNGPEISLYVRAYTAPSNCTRETENPSILSPLSDVLTVNVENIHTVSYNISDGVNDIANPPAYFTSENAVRLKSPVRSGYLFKGWHNAQGELAGTIPAGCEENLAFTAKWEAKQYSIYYILTQPTFEKDFSYANNSANPKLIFANESLPLNDIRSPYEGYVLGGWYETADFSTPALTVLPKGTSHDITLYAEWITVKEKAERDDTVMSTVKRVGDADNDGQVTSADARLTLRHAVKLERIDEKYIARVDFFKTSIISAACARTVLRMAVKLENAYDVISVFGITYLD